MRAIVDRRPGIAFSQCLFRQAIGRKARTVGDISANRVASRK